MSMDKGQTEATRHKFAKSDQGENRTSRRQLLRQMAGVSLGLPLAQWKSLPVVGEVRATAG